MRRSKAKKFAWPSNGAVPHERDRKCRQLERRQKKATAKLNRKRHHEQLQSQDARLFGWLRDASLHRRGLFPCDRSTMEQLLREYFLFSLMEERSTQKQYSSSLFLARLTSNRGLVVPAYEHAGIAEIIGVVWDGDARTVACVPSTQLALHTGSPLFVELSANERTTREGLREGKQRRLLLQIRNGKTRQRRLLRSSVKAESLETRAKQRRREGVLTAQQRNRKMTLAAKRAT